MTPTDPAPPPSESPGPSLAEPLLDRLRRHADLPGLGLTATRVAQLSSSDSRRGDLVNLVLADASLTQRTLRLANSVLYRRDNEPITTVSRALLMIGFDQVRMLALSQALLDKLENKTQSAALRAELGQAIFASMLAKRRFASQPQLAEEAAVCAMLRSVGRMMVAAYAFDVYSAVGARAAAERQSENRVMADLTGYGYDAVGQLMMADWGIPDRILHGCAAIPHTVSAPKTPDERLRTGTEFCAQAAAAMRAAPGPAREDRLTKLLERFGHALGVDRQGLDEQLTEAAGQARGLLEVLGLHQMVAVHADAAGTGSDNGALPSTTAGSQVQAEPFDPPWAGTEPAGAIAPLPATAGTDLPEMVRSASSAPLRAADPEQARAILLAGIGEMGSALASTYELADVLRIALEAIYRAFACRRAILCLHDPAGQGFRAALWIGDFDADRARQFHYAVVGQSHLFAAALQRNVDVYIRDALDGKIAASLPEALRRTCADARSFFLLPLVVREKPLGMFYADRATPDGGAVEAEELALLRALKGQALLALRIGNG